MVADPGCRPLRVTVLDMQPITPAIAGARLRLLGLYHGLAHCDATYVGTYDWPGEPHRRAQLSPGLVERLIPLTDAHFAAAEHWRARAGGRVIIDVSFPLLAHLSPGYVSACRESAAAADVVVFSHPWIYPLVSDLLDGKLVVYDSHNVEGVLRAALLADGGMGSALARHAALLEARLCEAADLILACSLDDRDTFHRLYRVPIDKICVAPNAAFTATTRPATTEERDNARVAVGCPAGPLCLFVGTAYGPNVEAAAFVAERLAPALPEVSFIVCGGVGEALRHLPPRQNLRITGTLEPALWREYLAAAEIAVNPMFSGSGTNVKMVELMAAGLPIVTTAVGARGIDQQGEQAFLVADAPHMADGIRRLLADPELACRLGRTARRHAEARYSWERISERLGHQLRRGWEARERPRPFFSVVVPTLGRPAQLETLLRRLEMQTCRDFEVIVVDQDPSGPPTREFDLDMAVIRTVVRGAVRSRNTGAACARGEVLAFVDDDCQPMPDWLSKARQRFDNPRIVGIEGRVMGHAGVQAGGHWVQNHGIEGLGFLTANLFVRREAFVRVGGFDESFDAPHFREDSDLGWRCRALGEIPFADDVLVYHPPREGPIPADWLERAFRKDALLFKKHPRFYRCLHDRERHHGSAGYRRGLLRGAEEYGVDVTGLLQAPVIARPLPDRRAALRVLSAPTFVATRSTFLVRLEATNESGDGWSALGDATGAYGVRLSYRWFDDRGDVVVESGVRSRLPFDVRPGETVEVFCRVIAPEKAGDYELLLTLVQEDVGWWDQGSGSAAIHRLVAAPVLLRPVL
jgi:glycosyltransferase involved in cell wall biosynthesis